MLNNAVNGLEGVVPEPGVTDNHEPPGGVTTTGATENPNAGPEPPLFTVKFCEPGLAPPTVLDTENDKTFGDNVEGRTVSVTGTTTDPFTACGDANVTLPL